MEIKPFQPLRRPMTLKPSRMARMVTARIAGFNPGTSPPPVNIPMTPFFLFVLVIFRLLLIRITKFLESLERARPPCFLSPREPPKSSGPAYDRYNNEPPPLSAFPKREDKEGAPPVRFRFA